MPLPKSRHSDRPVLSAIAQSSLDLRPDMFVHQAGQGVVEITKLAGQGQVFLSVAGEGDALRSPFVSSND
jgi:hypothetical protein